MIAMCTGRVSDVQEFSVEIDLEMSRGGVTLSVRVPDSQSYQLDSLITLYIHWHWTQDGGPQLYGFSSALKREQFRLLITCSGLGPKKALSVVSQVDPVELIGFLNSGDVSGLCQINGIGQKMAKLMVMQLKDRLDQLINLLPSNTDKSKVLGASLSKLTATLQALHYSAPEVRDAVAYIKKAAYAASFEEQLRASLGYLQARKTV